MFHRSAQGQDGTLAELARLNNDVLNSADFATILSVGAVGAGAWGVAFLPGWLSANPKDMTAVRHEFGHNFGGNHFNAGQHRPYAAGYKKASSILGGNHINYYSNPRLNHPIRGFPIGREGKNDMSRYITEQRFTIAKRGDESKPCFTCNAYSGQVFYYLFIYLGYFCLLCSIPTKSETKYFKV